LQQHCLYTHVVALLESRDSADSAKCKSRWRLNHPGIRQQQNYIGKKYTWQTLVDISHFNTLCWQRRFWLKKRVGTSTCVGGTWAQTWQCSAVQRRGVFAIWFPLFYFPASFVFLLIISRLFLHCKTQRVLQCTQTTFWHSSLEMQRISYGPAANRKKKTRVELDSERKGETIVTESQAARTSLTWLFLGLFSWVCRFSILANPLDAPLSAIRRRKRKQPGSSPDAIKVARPFFLSL
jgi:hypothetical protein